MKRFSYFQAAVFIILSLAPSTALPASSPDWLGESYDTVLSEEWMNVMFNNQKIGFSYNKIEKGDEGYRVTGRALMRLSVMGMTQDLSFSQTFYLDGEKKVLGFISMKKIQNQRQQTVGTVHGDRVELEITGAGGAMRSVSKLPPGTQFLETLGFVMSDWLEDGAKKTVPVYIIELRAVDTLTMEVTGRKRMTIDRVEKDVFVVDFKIQGFTTRSYVTAEGVTVGEEESLMGVTSKRVTEKEALSFPSGAVPAASLITFSLVKPDRPVPDPAPLTEMKFVIGGIDDPAFLPGDGRQTKGSPVWRNDKSGKRRLFIPLRTVKPPSSFEMTITEASRGSEEYLSPTPEAQSDNKMIIKTAREIIGGETDAWKAAQMINRWVNENVEKKLVDSFTAIDVLLSKEGECQSHTNLFTALARSVGIPTKVASGLVYSPANEGFLYHAWPEVYVGEWVAVDPTLGQEVADVTHIKLSEGGLENQLKLVRFLGKISLSVESYQ